MKMNESGISPKGDRIVVKIDVLQEKVTASGIVLPESERERYQDATSTGILVAVGKDAWIHHVETIERLIDGAWKVVERRTVAYSEPFAKVGERVSIAKFSGLKVTGEDGAEYRVLKDEDITTVVSEAVEFTDIKLRERL